MNRLGHDCAVHSLSIGPLEPKHAAQCDGCHGPTSEDNTVGECRICHSEYNAAQWAETGNRRHLLARRTRRNDRRASN
jgi:hypothetical protein